jgi:rhomboid protease GluP
MTNFQQPQMRRFLKKPFVMYIFLGIQTIVFIFQYLIPTLGLENRFGMYGPSIYLQHEFWRFITPMFLHYGLMHFVVNSVILYYMGSQCELLFGHWRLALVYLGSGLLGNVASFSFNTPGVLSIGASTALFGLFGAFLMVGIRFRDNPAVKVLVRQFTIFIVFNFIFGMTDASIDLLGHLGGLIGGALLGGCFGIPNAPKSFSTRERVVAGVLFVIFVVFCILIGFNKYSSLV